jgi:hypothetical protein
LGKEKKIMTLRVNTDYAFKNTTAFRQRIGGRALSEANFQNLATKGFCPIDHYCQEARGTALLLLSSKQIFGEQNASYQVRLDAVDDTGLIGFIDFTKRNGSDAVCNEAHQWVTDNFSDEVKQELVARYPKIHSSNLRYRAGFYGEFTVAMWVQDELRRKSPSINTEDHPPLSTLLMSSAVMLSAGLSATKLVLENVGCGYIWRDRPNTGFNPVQERLKEHYIKSYGAYVLSERIRRMAIDIS